MRDETKRQSIIQSSKMLFSQKGFFNTSISDIVKETGFPVGTIYTYFQSKDEIVRVIVEEGWADVYQRLEAALSTRDKAEDKLRLLIEAFLPELLQDLELISILLSEAIDYTHIEEKLEKLTDLISALIRPLVRDQSMLQRFPRRSMEAAVAVIFLGVMNAVKVARSSSIGLKVSDITGFLKVLIESSFDLEL
jgi:AcrR family transcriptional regulator